MRRVGEVPWPDTVAAQYVDAGYWREVVLGDLPAQWARRHGDRVAVVDGERELSYAQLARAADAVAARLLGLGLRDGDNILLQLPNSWEFLAVLLGCARVGVAPVMALTAHRDHELVGLAQAADAAAIVVAARHRGFDHEELAHRVAAKAGGRCRVLVVGAEAGPGSLSLHGALAADGPVPVPSAPGPRPQDIAVILLSGGTTGGQPKMIGRTHRDYEYNFRRMGELCGLDDTAVYLVVLPVGHNFALGCPGVLGTLAAGGKVVLLPTPEPGAAFAAIARHRVTAVALVPAVAQRWLEGFDPSRDDLSSLSLVQVGGARCPAPVATRLAAEFGCAVQQVFGMAEGLLNCTRLDDPPETVATTQGRPISPADEIRVVAADGAAAERGELLTRGPYTPRGYFRGEAHNGDKFTADGWYRTGDMVWRHPSGNLVVEGRGGDVVNRAGEKISALEVEDLACLLPQVLAAAALAVPDASTGERLCLFAVLRPEGGLDLEMLRAAFLAQGVAAFKVPEQLEILDALPLTPVGKPDRKRLLEIAAGTGDPAMANPPRWLAREGRRQSVRGNQL